jgi:hypothetical protein
MNSFLLNRIGLILAVAVSRGFAADPAAVAPAGTAPTNAPGPKIQFASTVYDFGKVIAGEPVKTDFIFTNTGDALLEIAGVYPQCGCTTAGTWTRQVEPGQTGVIPLQFNTARFVGTVAKTATVMPKNLPVVTLQLKGTIWKPITVNPQMAVLNIVTDGPTNQSAKVNITSSLDQPLTLSEPTSSNPALVAEIKTVQPGKEFELIITPRLPLPQGNLQGTIVTKTSFTNVPTIEVSALVVVQPAIVVVPAQIALPPGPLTTAFPCTVSIRNNSVKPLTLSAPTVNAPGVDVQINEVRPGSQFNAVLTFPAGFRMATGEDVTFRVTTSQPLMPELKVPVRQASRPPPPGLQPPSQYRGPMPPQVPVPPPAPNP